MATTATSRQAFASRHGWVEPLARAGYATKGIVYALIGVLAIQAAVGDGREGAIGGGETAVRTIGQQPFGAVLLGVVGFGLFAYAAWRLVQALLDPESAAPDGAKGVAKRLAWGVSGAIYAGLGVAALQMALGNGAPSGGGGPSWAAKVMTWSFGPTLVVLAGAAVIVFALQQMVHAWTLDFRRRLAVTKMSATERRWAIRVGRAGIFARAVVLLIVGGGIVKAGLARRPSEAGGVGEALHDLASQPYGTLLLAIVAAGLVAYGVYQLVEARYRRIPSRG